jgi:hypothetical protein
VSFGGALSDAGTELPPAFQGVDAAVIRFSPTDPCRIVAPVFALNYGEVGLERLPALTGLPTAAPLVHGNPVSPVFFGLADGVPTTPAGPSPDALDPVYAGLGDGTDDALWAF